MLYIRGIKSQRFVYDISDFSNIVIRKEWVMIFILIFSKHCCKKIMSCGFMWMVVTEKMFLLGMNYYVLDQNFAI